jgi:hypothetical protein
MVRLIGYEWNEYEASEMTLGFFRSLYSHRFDIFEDEKKEELLKSVHEFLKLAKQFKEEKTNIREFATTCIKR